MSVPLIDFEDAVNAASLDPAAKYAVYYADGRFANRAAVAARCPHAKLFGITVLGATGHGIFACDSELGDLTIPQTETWVAAQVRLGVEPIVVYANQDRWENQGLLAALAHYGHRIKRWVANFDGVRAIPSWADADQYSTGAVDKDVALANFFATAPPPAPDHRHYDWFQEGPFELAGEKLNERHIVETYDRLRANPIRNRHHLRPIRDQLSLLAGRIISVAEEDRASDGDPGYNKYRRSWRLQQILLRAEGHRIA